MVSFASDVKKELTQITVDHEHARAELAAIIRMNGSVAMANKQLILNIQTENAAIARRIYSLLKDHFATISELAVRRKMKLKKNNVYVVRVTHNASELLQQLQIMDNLIIQTNISKDIMENEQRNRSYLRGAFLAGGSVNNPEKSSYHLEIYSAYEDHNSDIIAMMNHFDLNAKGIARRNGYIAYIKEAEKIADFLAIIGAMNARLKYEDIRIVRDMRNSVNRIVNCENANLNKTVSAAAKQIENIELIQRQVGLHQLPDKLQEVALARIDNPDMSLKELGEQLSSGPVSKSSMNHRFRKIKIYAEKLRETS